MKEGDEKMDTLGIEPSTPRNLRVDDLLSGCDNQLHHAPMKTTLSSRLNT